MTMRLTRLMRRNVALWLVAGGLTLGSASFGWGQGSLGGSSSGLSGISQGSGQRGASQTSPTPQVPALDSDEPGLSTRHTAEEMERARNSDRQKKLVEETQRLLALANELKEDVDKSTKDTLSLDVVRKADEIEKLAHSVKEKMKGS
jgi:hypothetical protein